jgi:hypothetical protein
MVRHIDEDSYSDRLEYHGCNVIERVRTHHFNATVVHDWMVFDSVEEAEEYFNEHGWPLPQA